MFEQPFKNIKRVREIVQVLIKYGFEDFVAETALRRIVPEQTRLSWTRKDKSVFEYKREERIRMALEELGGTYIKLAQLLSNRPDIIPDELILEFQKLQSQAPAFSTEKAKQIIEDEMGYPVEKLFSFFDPRPLGAASIGQVHRAKLRTGEEVVVKIQRPGVRDIIEADLDIIKIIVKRGENYLASIGLINPMDIVHAFEKSIMKELDYLNEARNIEQFRKFYQDDPNFIVPIAYKGLSTEKVLIMEFVSGCKITDIKRLEEWGLDPKEIAVKGLDIYLKQIFEAGYFHADPHPGNVLVRPDGVIVLIDFGMVGKLMQQDKFALAGIFISMAQQNARGMANNFRKLSLEGDIEDMQALEYDLNEFIEDFANLEVEELSVADMARRLQQIIFKYRIRVPGAVFLILRALAILDGIGKIVHPEFNAFDYIRPYGVKILKEQFSVENLGMELFYAGSQFFSFMYSLPLEVKSILKKIRKGKILVQVEHQGYEVLIRQFELAANKLVIAIIIAALLIAASLSLNTDLPRETVFTNLPYLSLIELIIALTLSIFLFIIFLKKVRRKKKNGNGQSNGDY
ncbi:MAG: ABC1 kinase family protein [Flammeovirgaceae bacterium]